MSFQRDFLSNDFVRSLDSSEDDYAKLKERILSDYDQCMEKCDAVINSKETPEEMKIVASLVKRVKYDDLVRVSTQRYMLENIKVVTLALQVLDLKLIMLEEKIAKSGILDKAKIIEDYEKIKQTLVDATKKAQDFKLNQDEAFKELEERRQII
jgi:hypothetical protein